MIICARRIYFCIRSSRRLFHIVQNAAESRAFFFDHQTPSMNDWVIAGFVLMALAACCVFLTLVLDRCENDDMIDSSKDTSESSSSPLRRIFSPHLRALFGAFALAFSVTGAVLIFLFE